MKLPDKREWLNLAPLPYYLLSLLAPPLPLTEWTSFTLGQMMLRVLYNDLDAWVECSNRSVAGASFLQVGI